MNNKNKSDLKRNRFLLYLLIAFLVTVLDFLGEINNENSILEQELFFATLTLPSVIGVTYLLYFLRKWTLNSRFYKSIQGKGVLYQRLFWGVAITTMALVLTFFTRYLSIVILPEFDSGIFFDFLFLGIFIGIFFVGLFVHALESFSELQKENQQVQIRIKDIENEKLIAKFLNLKNQLNPHFLFNSFNSLSGLISMNPKKADYFLSELSKVYRYTLDQSDELVVPLSKELELIRSYIALQQIRFGKSLVIDYNVAASDLKKMVPPMTLELLVENAIKHNIVEKERPLEVSVYTKDNYVIVSNNYQPRNDSNQYGDSTGKGLHNLINQYDIIHTEKPKFEVRNGKYTAIVPLIEAT
ncbi:sensor histidine kinase [Zobellia roscoffensis]|uniref:sensor histidine kinase n=1 Tax=Zobellia roscoffensis TaxID=2779508 RepID=UPI0039EFE018